MKQLAMKFVQWNVSKLVELKDSKVYKLNREEKNWLTRNTKECCYFKRGIAYKAFGFFYDSFPVSDRINMGDIKRIV